MLYGNLADLDNAAENKWACNIHEHIPLRSSADYNAASGGLLER